MVLLPFVIRLPEVHMGVVHRILEKKATGIHQNHLFPRFGLEKSAYGQQDFRAVLEFQRIRVVILFDDTASVTDHHLLIGVHLTAIKFAVVTTRKTVLLDNSKSRTNDGESMARSYAELLDRRILPMGRKISFCYDDYSHMMPVSVPSSRFKYYGAQPYLRVLLSAPAFSVFLALPPTIQSEHLNPFLP